MHRYTKNNRTSNKCEFVLNRVKCSKCRSIVPDNNFCELCGSYLGKFICTCANKNIKPHSITLELLGVYQTTLNFVVKNTEFVCTKCFSKIPIHSAQCSEFLLDNQSFVTELKKEIATIAMHNWYCTHCEALSQFEHCTKCQKDTVVLNRANVENIPYSAEITQEFFKLTSGIYWFDDLIQNGFPYDTSAIFIAPSGEEKETFEIQYIEKGLKNKESVLVAINYDVNEFKRRVKERKIDVEYYIKEGYLSIIDLYSAAVDTIRTSHVVNGIVVSGKDLSSLGISISLAIKQLRPNSVKRALLRTISYAFLVSKNHAFDFTRDTILKLKNNHFTSLFPVERGAYDEKNLSMISELLDGYIEIETLKKEQDATLHINKKIGVLRMKSTNPDAIYHNVVLKNNILYVI